MTSLKHSNLGNLLAGLQVGLFLGLGGFIIGGILCPT